MRDEEKCVFKICLYKCGNSFEYSLIFNMIETFKKTGSSEFITPIWEFWKSCERSESLCFGGRCCQGCSLRHSLRSVHCFQANGSPGFSFCPLGPACWRAAIKLSVLSGFQRKRGLCSGPGLEQVALLLGPYGSVGPVMPHQGAASGKPHGS